MELNENYNNNRPEKDILINRLSSKNRRENGKYKEWLKSEYGMLSVVKSQEKRKAKKHVISKNEWLACKDYLVNSCVYCGLHISEHFIIYTGEFKWTDLHKEQVDDHGANDLRYCVPSCKECNSQKWEFELSQWYNVNNPVFTTKRYEKILRWLTSE